ncbi:uncharacterized protein [Nicotiana tomentosiformis]|uniref:uncharacterized protein n=1 Tax=Nicotiana tomentosiformis TaxID=4098 RepID=UPI00388CC32E
MGSWEFLEEILLGYRFPERFVQLIMACVTSPKFSVTVNGELHGYFEGQRGLRQGEETSVNRVMEALKHFSEVSGLIANLDKSNIFMAAVTDQTKERPLDDTGFSEGSFPIRYLGLPLSPKKWSKLECQQLIEKITHRIKVTYEKKLSYAGRLQVITAVLFSIYSFWGAVFILPQSVLKEVDKRCRDYLWGTSEDKRRVPLVSWEKICCPKKNGGLNIKGCSSWNKASVGKLLWQLTQSKNSLWVKWVHDIYIKNDPNVWSHTAPQDFSWYWKKLNSLKEKMQEWYVQGKYILTPKGDYSITSSYNALLGGQVKMENASLVWSKFAQPKHRFIAWLATKKRLLTKERLGQMRIIVIDMDCCLCDDQEIETSQHLFGNCPWIHAIRRSFLQWTNTQLHAGEPKLVFDVIRRKHW